ncbi:hypothetical protein A0123_00584 [Gluconobacter cerinus]|uniref:Uncharacterized protein n=1 Tax=Gluconobacter cerinus TaxID=38307 RepID=A0A1B6VP90_9PROT|nr:hypothetical protein A0123_00584 [Gluconobacter cerinus]
MSRSNPYVSVQWMSALCLALSIIGATIALISVFAVLPPRTEILDFVLGQLLGWLGVVVGFLAERRSKKILAREIEKINATYRAPTHQEGGHG